LARDVEGQSSHFGTVFLMRELPSMKRWQIASASGPGSMPSIRTLANAIVHRFGSQLPFITIDLLFGRHRDASQTRHPGRIQTTLVSKDCNFVQELLDLIHSVTTSGSASV